MKIHHALIIVAVALLAVAILSEAVPALKLPMTWASIGSVMFGFLCALFSMGDKSKRETSPGYVNYDNNPYDRIDGTASTYNFRNTLSAANTSTTYISEYLMGMRPKRQDSLRELS